MKTNIVGTPKGIGKEALHIADVIERLLNLETYDIHYDSFKGYLFTKQSKNREGNHVSRKHLDEIIKELRNAL